MIRPSKLRIYVGFYTIGTVLIPKENFYLQTTYASDIFLSHESAEDQVHFYDYEYI
jgi:hypothetical protein